MAVRRVVASSDEPAKAPLTHLARIQSLFRKASFDEARQHQRMMKHPSFCNILLGIGYLAQQVASQSTNDTSIATPPNGASCWDNTTEIFNHLTDAPPFSSNTYIFCPNTVFDIGYTDSNGDCCEDGELPLAARTNTKYQCGEDGSSANNCVIFGGSLQLLITALSFSESEVSNFIVQGLTFTRAGLLASAPALPGDVTFLDCIFEDSQNSGTIIALYQPSRRRRRLTKATQSLELESIERRLGYAVSEAFLEDAMADAMEERKYNARSKISASHDVNMRHRNLQQDVCQVYFNGTVFRNNTQGATQGATTYGVVTARASGNFLSFDNCLFAENQFGNRETFQQGYAIESWGSEVAIRNTCFIQNNFIGFGPVHIWDKGIFNVDGVYGDADDELQCTFLAYSRTQPEDASQVTCTDYDADTCLADIDADLIPDPVPTPQPVATPAPNDVSSPTRAPSDESSQTSGVASRRRDGALVAAVLSSFVTIFSFCI
ncbi:hypothetical protein MPSEU_001095900 [Mayamaea pseudoterrestris]|nr:hypothetical protein MPSEU_001095900 [Mayamaea pseudoterrestris]